MKLIECVPNFSEGRDKYTIAAIKSSIEATENVTLLNLESDEDYNRTVATFIGNEKSVLQAALNSSREAAKRIDMRFHRGVHPRIGAIDVVPFIPVKNSSLEECVKISKKFGKTIGNDLKIPVYLYEESAVMESRRNLANIRSGEYEGLPEKLNLEEWKPDYGKPNFNPKTGALATGARFFLIAYNVNLLTTDLEIAKKIAGSVRESGMYSIKDKVRIPGKLKSIKAIGVFLSKNNICQVSMNLTNYKVTPLHAAFEAVEKEAKKLGVKIAGSEIVGMVPKEALIESGKYFSEKEMDETALLNLTIQKLGLNLVSEFEIRNKIIEFKVGFF